MKGEGERMGDEAGGGMHATVFRGPQDQDASRVSPSREKNKVCGYTQHHNTTLGSEV